MTDVIYRIKYRKGDYELEIQGDKEWVEQKFKELTESKMIVPEAPTTEAKMLPGSLVEFLKSKGNTKKHTDIAAIFSYWLYHKEKMTSYNIDDIGKCYDEARIPKPKNLTDTMNKIQKKGYVKPAPQEKEGKKAWVITETGEKYIEKMKA